MEHLLLLLDGSDDDDAVRMEMAWEAVQATWVPNQRASRSPRT